MKYDYSDRSVARVRGGIDMPPGSVVGEVRKTERGQRFVWTGEAWLWDPA